MEDKLIAALEQLIRTKDELIAHLREEIARLKTPNVVFSTPNISIPSIWPATPPLNHDTWITITNADPESGIKGVSDTSNAK